VLDDEELDEDKDEVLEGSEVLGEEVLDNEDDDEDVVGSTTV